MLISFIVIVSLRVRELVGGSQDVVGRRERCVFERDGQAERVEVGR